MNELDQKDSVKNSLVELLFIFISASCAAIFTNIVQSQNSRLVSDNVRVAYLLMGLFLLIIFLKTTFYDIDLKDNKSKINKLLACGYIKLLLTLVVLILTFFISNLFQKKSFLINDFYFSWIGIGLISIMYILFSNTYWMNTYGKKKLTSNFLIKFNYFLAISGICLSILVGFYTDEFTNLLVSLLIAIENFLFF